MNLMLHMRLVEAQASLPSPQGLRLQLAVSILAPELPFELLFAIGAPMIWLTKSAATVAADIYFMIFKTA